MGVNDILRVFSVASGRNMKLALYPICGFRSALIKIVFVEVKQSLLQRFLRYLCIVKSINNSGKNF